MGGRDFDLLDGDWYVHDPYPDYAWLRENAPVYWDAGNELWGISRYDDIVEIEKRKDVFVNSDTRKGGYRPNIPADPSIIGLDDPKHAERRNLVSRRFTPRAVTRWEDHVRETVTELVDGAVAKGRIDVVDDLAAPLPAQMIGFLLGFPDEAWPQLMDWSERTIHLGGGPRYHDEDGIVAAFEFAGACAELYETKQGCPADDVMSLYVDVEKRGLKHQDFGVDEVDLRLPPAARRRGRDDSHRHRPRPSSAWPTTPTSGRPSRPAPTSTWPSRSSSAG